MTFVGLLVSSTLVVLGIAATARAAEKDLQSRQESQLIVHGDWLVPLGTGSKRSGNKRVRPR